MPKRPVLGRQELIQILVADAANKGVIVFCTQGDLMSAYENSVKFWRSARERLASVIADRLLDPNGQGPLLDRSLVSKHIADLAVTQGAFPIPDVPKDVRNLLIQPTVDLILSMGGGVDLEETYESRWQRLEAVCHLANGYGLAPAEFLTKIPDAGDWVLRVSSTPEEHRARQRARIDALHPDHVQKRIHAFETAIQERLGGNLPTGLKETLMFSVPQGDAYWAFRAKQFQVIEQHIDYLWPGQGLGSKQVFTDDA